MKYDLVVREEDLRKLTKNATTTQEVIGTRVTASKAFTWSKRSVAMQFRGRSAV